MSIKRSRNPFKRRINVERKVLKIVNETLTECQPLVGLTEEAIVAWAVDLNSKFGHRRADDIVEIIMDISKRSRLNTDRSRDVFSSENVRSPVPLADLVELLVASIAKIH